VQFRNDPEHGMVATRAPLSNCTTKVTL
jgi:hypothetical protein